MRRPSRPSGTTRFPCPPPLMRVRLLSKVTPQPWRALGESSLRSRLHPQIDRSVCRGAGPGTHLLRHFKSALRHPPTVPRCVLCGSSLRLAEATYLHAPTNERPILLLDDVF